MTTFQFGFALAVILLLNFFWLPAYIFALPVNVPKLQCPNKRLNILSELIDRGLYKESVEYSTELIKKHCLDKYSLGYAYCLRGNARALLNQYAKAIGDIDTGLTINPNIDGKGELYGTRGTCLMGLGRYGESIESFNKSLSVDPSGMAFYLRGTNFFRLKKYVFAVRDFDRAMQYADCPDDARKMRALASRNILRRKSIQLHQKRGTHTLRSGKT